MEGVCSDEDVDHVLVCFSGLACQTSAAGRQQCANLLEVICRLAGQSRLCVLTSLLSVRARLRREQSTASYAALASRYEEMVSEVVSSLAEDSEEAVRAAVAANLPAVAASFSSGLPEGTKDGLRRSDSSHVAVTTPCLLQHTMQAISTRDKGPRV